MRRSGGPGNSPGNGRGGGCRPPARVLQAAKAAFVERPRPGDLVPLVWDSDTDGRDPDPSRDRPAAASRLLRFTADGCTVELVVERAVPGCRALRGRLVPAQDATVSLQRRAAVPLPACADGAGGFAVDGVAPGLVRLRVVRPGCGALVTGWVLVD